MMQHLNTLTQIVNAASAVSDLTRKEAQYRFVVAEGGTLYVHIASALVQIQRTDGTAVEVSASLQVPIAWRIAAEQDDAGAYFVALRRSVVGGLASAQFTLSVPASLHIMLRLEDASLQIAGVSALLELPPASDGRLRIVLPEAGR